MVLSWAHASCRCVGNSLAESLEIAEGSGWTGCDCGCGAVCVWCVCVNVPGCGDRDIGSVILPDLSVIGDCVTAGGVPFCWCSGLVLWAGAMCACDGMNSGASALSTVFRFVSVVDAGDGTVVDVVSSVVDDDDEDVVPDEDDDEDDEGDADGDGGR